LAALFSLAMLYMPISLAAQDFAPQPSPSALQVAKQIVNIRVSGMFESILPEAVETTKGMFMAINFMWAKDLNETAEVVQKQYEPRAAELIDQCARIFAAHFTEQELRDLLSFYQSPLGKKALIEEPRVVDESLSYAQTWADHLREEVAISMRAEMKRRGHEMP
jgi:hypothetical protein